MSKPQPKEETILLEEDTEDEDIECIRGPYRERIYSDSVRVHETTSADNLRILREFSIYEDSGLTYCGVPIYFSK